MFLYECWKGLIKDIKGNFFEVGYVAGEMLLLIVVSPFMLFLDLLISPFEICYFIVNYIRNRGDK